MKAGERDRLITFLQPVTTTSPSGMTKETFQEFSKAWAKKMDSSAMEDVEKVQRVAERSTVFEVPYFAELRETWNISYDGRTYEILGISEIGRRAGLSIETHLKDNQ